MVTEFIPILEKINLINSIGQNIKTYKFKFEEHRILFSIPDEELSIELKCDIEIVRSRKKEITNKSIL